ncbi:MAG: DUF4145 domain-containing protein [Candidatus Helarchaeota archaeon]
MALARRALQLTCIDKGANPKSRLVKQIEELFTTQIITIDLKNLAHSVRWVGNDAVHPNAEEVIDSDAEDVLNLTEQLLYVLYVAPALAKKQKDKRRK